ncbi:MAG: hypothetical protein IT452_17995 [Planctomycetia bacterium]|nr:hypothetical protein [Planctomycetia bacterium]
MTRDLSKGIANAVAAIRLPDVLTLAQLAAALGLKSASGMRRLLLRGTLGIPYVRSGRRFLIRRQALMEALEQHERRPPESPSVLPARDAELVRKILSPRRVR